jgi:crotonobetainyl-CoA:carnitine CoA-transferase CaiB-like acyl-CoA transferase
VNAKAAMLEGIRIADLTSVIFGPYCTEMLAELGADVVKVEPPTGDTLRMLGRPAKTTGMGKLHMTINRGKRSVSWDIKTEEGRDNLRRLISSSDVFIHNIRAEAIKKLGFDYGSVRAFAPEIVYVHCTGFDSAGPDAGMAAYDDIIQGAAGIAALFTEAEGRAEPGYMPVALADKVAGLYALQGVLAAIIHKLRFGEGQFVEVPMFESVTAFHLLENFAGAVFPDEPGKIGYRHTSDARRPCRTTDGYICLAPYNKDRWERFFEIIGRPEILKDERLNTPWLRKKNNDLLYGIVEEITPTRSTAEWLDIMRQADIPATRFNSLEDLLQDPQLGAVGFFRERAHPTEGRFLDLRPAVRFSALPDPMPGLPPHLGEHNEEVAAELGLAGPGVTAANDH